MAVIDRHLFFQESHNLYRNGCGDQDLPTRCPTATRAEIPSGQDDRYSRDKEQNRATSV